MSTLLESELPSVSQRKKISLQKRKHHCFSQTKRETAFDVKSFKKNLLDLPLFVGLFYQTSNPCGLLTSVAQTNNNSSTLVTRAYDAEGHLISEATSLNGKAISSWNQTWDRAGDRTQLNWNFDKQGPSYRFSYNALGLMTTSQNGSETCSYNYRENGLLLSKTTPLGTTTVTHDPRGNIVRETLPGNSVESLTWNALGKISSYAISGPHQNETRNYGYDNRGRLTEEPYTLMSSANPALLSAGTQTASYTFDPLNIRLSQEVTTAVANAVTEKNIFSQVVGEHLLNDRLAQEAWESSYDRAGEVITRTSSSGVTQNLTWDSFGRLVKVADNKTTWTAIYDGLGRRIQTSVGSNAINHYYDPEVEFLELGHATTKETTTSSWWYGPIHHEVLCYNWNLYGPDRSGLYGGAQGIGGLEVEGGSATLQNYFGDVIGLGSSGVIANYGATFTSYGLAPGSAPDAASQSLTPQWRGRYLDETGFVSMGARYYEPHGGRFLSADPLGHDASLSLYDYCNGDPLNGLDPDGRCGTGGVKGYALGSFAHYDNIAQAIGGFIGTGLSYITPGLGEIALARDVAGSAWHGAQALGDMYSNGINWSNSLEVGLATAGIGLGAWSALLPARVGVEVVASGAAIEESSQVLALPTIRQPEGGLVIGRGSDLSRPFALAENEFKLSWPSIGTVRSEWKMNSGLLRQEMQIGIPIRDASPGNVGGMYLNAERNLLQARSWNYNSTTGYWHPLEN